jgi:carbamoyltransferase
MAKELDMPIANLTRVDHHLAHALSAWPVADNFDWNLVIDGYGEIDCTWTLYKGLALHSQGSVDSMGSIGLAMNYAALDLGITAGHVLDYSGKLMGLQSYGTVDQGFLTQLSQYGLEQVNRIFDPQQWRDYLGSDVLARNRPLDWIATVHSRVGSALVEFLQRYVAAGDTISYTGGVAQNVIWNSQLKRAFPGLEVIPHCGDEGLSLGAIEYLRRHLELEPFSLESFPYVQSDHSPEAVDLATIKLTAELLAQGKTVAWYQGHGEVGPRALGNRSLLIDPRVSGARDRINRVKRREQYRPFGASVLAEHAEQLFDLPWANPYMLYVGVCQDPCLSSITHVDGTSRVQTVAAGTHSFRLLLEEFYRLTGCPVLLNTSLNLAGKPIAGDPTDAQELYATSDIDCLVIGSTITAKS